MSETRADPLIEGRLDRLEDDIDDIKATLVRLEPMIISINATLPYLATKEQLAELRGEIHTGLAELPHLATKAELTTALARLPTRAEMWGMMAAMTGAFAVILTALTFLQHWLK